MFCLSDISISLLPLPFICHNGQMSISRPNLSFELQTLIFSAYTPLSQMRQHLKLKTEFMVLTSKSVSSPVFCRSVKVQHLNPFAHLSFNKSLLCVFNVSGSVIDIRNVIMNIKFMVAALTDFSSLFLIFYPHT